MEPETLPAPRVRATSLGAFLRSNTKWLLTAVALIAAAGAIAVSAHQPTATPSHTPAGAVNVGAVVGPGCTLLPQETPPPGTSFEFGTNFAKHCVHYSEILSGGPIKDGIPAIDAPKIVTVGAADAWLRPVEPVISFQVGGDARAYPIQILIWHEVVNDTAGGVPVTVTFCPLCNTAIAFERTVNGRVLDFGTTGRLRFSNLVMYDRQTESWWQQALGLAIAGEYTGTQLVARPAAIKAAGAHPGRHCGWQRRGLPIRHAGHNARRQRHRWRHEHRRLLDAWHRLAAGRAHHFERARCWLRHRVRIRAKRSAAHVYVRWRPLRRRADGEPVGRLGQGRRRQARQTGAHAGYLGRERLLVRLDIISARHPCVSRVSQGRVVELDA